MLDYRFIEACALLPMLHVPVGGPTTVLCVGPAAEAFAASVCRWRDVGRIILLGPPENIRDHRIEVVTAIPIGRCHAVLTSPDMDITPYAAALSRNGILCASTGFINKAADFYRSMRQLFRPIKPWREHLPGPLFGMLASPTGTPSRHRDPPASAKRLNNRFVPSLFTFGSDEARFVFGPQQQDANDVLIPTDFN